MSEYCYKSSLEKELKQVKEMRDKYKGQLEEAILNDNAIVEDLILDYFQDLDTIEINLKSKIIKEKKQDQKDTEAHRIWKKVQRLLELRFEEKSKYNTWVKPLKAVEYKNNVLRLNSDCFISYTFEKNYKSFAEDILSNIIKTTAKIEMSPETTKTIW